MAIDDAKNYTLTGAQIKELPSLIDSVKGMSKELSTDDYDFPTGSPTGVALWLLPSGIYFAPENVAVHVSRQKMFTAGAGGMTFINIQCGGGKTISVAGDWDTERTAYWGPYVSFLINGGTSGTSGYFVNNGNLATQIGKAMEGQYMGQANQAASTAIVAQALNIGSSGHRVAPTTTDSAALGSLWMQYDPNDPTVGHIYMCTAQDYVHNNWTWIQLI